MRIGIIVDWMSPNITAAAELLRQRGAQIELIWPEKQTFDLAAVQVQNDLYLIKSASALAMSLAGTLHALGARTLNPYPTVVRLRDKIIVTRLLQHAGIPTPETYVTTAPREVAPLLKDGPLILKPYNGARSEGIHIVSSAEELDAIATGVPILAQRYHKPDGRDHVIFRIGAELFGVRRNWPLKSYEDKIGEPFTPSPELCDIAMRIGQLFGIDLYGFDVVISGGQPYIVDVKKFASYMGVPDAPRRLADYIYVAAQRGR